MLFEVVLLGLGVLVNGQGQKCCTPNVWQANGRATAGTFMEVEREKIPGREHRDSVIYYDFDGERLAHDDLVEYGDGTSESSKVIELHRSRRGYLIRQNECFRFELGEMRKACVPENAEYTGTFRWGLGVGHNLTVDRFSGDLDAPREVGAYVVFWTHTGCLPVTSAVFREEENSERQLTGVSEGHAFSELSPTISNPEAFDPPPSCEFAAEISPRDKRLENHHSLKRALSM